MNPEAWPAYLMLAVMWATAMAYFVFLLWRSLWRKPPQHAHCGVCNERLSEWFANRQRRWKHDDPIGMRCFRCGTYSPWLTHGEFREAWLSARGRTPKPKPQAPDHDQTP